ncbi:MAG TPA: HU family DNA-binding protein [Coxiellaceae bacterium]|nr:HU family DNA-binding protein [Coxiellaceae bacterium]
MASKKAKKTKKTVAKKQPARRVAAKKKAVKAVAKKPAVKRLGVVSKALNKSQVLSCIADQSGVPKKQVACVFDELAHVIECHLKKGGAGEFVLPGLMKCKVIRKPATKARKGINPFTGEPTTFKAKPARNVVKIRPLKKVKEMVK